MVSVSTDHGGVSRYSKEKESSNTTQVQRQLTAGRPTGKPSFSGCTTTALRTNRA